MLWNAGLLFLSASTFLSLGHWHFAPPCCALTWQLICWAPFSWGLHRKAMPGEEGEGQAVPCVALGREQILLCSLLLPDLQ